MRVKDDIVRLLREGHAYNRIAEELSCSKATVAYHARKIGVAPGIKIHPWPEVQQYHDAGHSVRECLTRFGISRSAWYAACEQGRLVTQDRRIPLQTLVQAGRATGRTHLKGRLLRAGLLKPECGECGLTTWRGQPLSLELHHKNGVNNDNRLDNLLLLCPNCHSQTPTYSGRNAQSRRPKIDAG